MDKIITKTKWGQRKFTMIAFATIAIGLCAGSYYLATSDSELSVDKDQLTISVVSESSFNEFIPVNAIVMPLTTIYLDAEEGGRVEEIFVEDGASLKKGEPILQLANTDLELSLANQETAVFDVQTQMQNTRNNSEQNTIRQLNQMAEVENGLAEAERIYGLNKRLYEKKVIALQELRSSENNYKYQVKRKLLTEATLKKDSTSAIQEIKQMQRSYSRMQNALLLMRSKVGDLIVRAPVTGQLTSLDAEIGQLKTVGNRLGQIDVVDGFKVRANIDEHYISRVFPGLNGHFNLGSKEYELRVSKIYTQVTDGHFQVDMAFKGAVPHSVRRGQTLQVRLALSDPTKAVLLPKGSFYKQTGGDWVYKLNKEGTVAQKVPVQLGRQNPDNYEVLNGLLLGDQVVTSSYDTFGDMNRLKLK